MSDIRNEKQTNKKTKTKRRRHARECDSVITSLSMMVVWKDQQAHAIYEGEK